jgi:hypothetical protein
MQTFRSSKEAARLRELRFEVRDALWDGRGYGRSWTDRDSDP